MKNKDDIIEQIGLNGFEEKYIQAFYLLADIWDNMDADRKKRLGIWDEVEGQLKAQARCFTDLEKFLTKLCNRFDSFLF